MKLLTLLALAATATSHAIFQKVSVNGVDQGQLKGVRAPSSNNPVQNWAVDTMISNGGWYSFDLPTCVAPGDYLMRVELLALHGASVRGEAQFYFECAQIRVTGSGANTGSNFVSFPGAYSATDPGVLVSIYGNTGQPDNGGRTYAIPGPRPITCSGSPPPSSPPPSTPPPSTPPPSTPPPSTPPPSSPPPSSGGGGSAQLWGQCGGNGWTGPTTCASGTCKVSSEYYSQCLP
ncbi:hypothetical protein BN1708_011228 [Verticillium longisporum]|uniref:lytic cellulose monooxygenase (C4-dehydrogenating) n=1 Tax=Verticillium longisporum TaxID=100787 RepID=A0A0G4KY44_VERLO|nr:hypothetical protein BN1708_011228 [Verticillium longisporum]